MSHRKRLRQIAAEAGIPVAEARKRIEAAGREAPHPQKFLEGRELREVRIALGLVARPRGSGAQPERLTEEELDRRMLGPLLRKGKVGRTHTTPIENVYGHGIPDHQKAEAKDRVEAYLKDGLLEEKVSQGRRHVWLTASGTERSKRLEENRNHVPETS